MRKLVFPLMVLVFLGCTDTNDEAVKNEVEVVEPFSWNGNHVFKYSIGDSINSVDLVIDTTFGKIEITGSGELTLDKLEAHFLPIDSTINYEVLQNYYNELFNEVESDPTWSYWSFILDSDIPAELYLFKEDSNWLEIRANITSQI